MRNYLPRFLSLLALLICVGVFFAFPSNAQAAPSVRVLPNPVSAGQGANLSVSGCGNQQEAEISWDKHNDGESIDIEIRTTNPSGDVSYFHSEFDAGTYAAWVVCNNGSSKDEGFTFRVVETCEYVSALSFTANPTTEPYTTATEFTFTGKIANCSAADLNSSGAPNLSLFGDTEEGSEELVASRITLDDQGNFTQKEFLRETGTWSIHVESGTAILDGKTLAIIIGTQASPEEEEIACNEGPFDSSLEIEGRCEAGCDPTFLPGGWYCGGGDTSCQLEEDIFASTDKVCDEAKEIEIVAPGTCGTGGILCGDGSFCYQGEGDDKKIMCESDKYVPPPLPPNAQCLEFDPPLTEGTEETLRQCIKVKTAIGEIATNPEGFVKSLFGFLLSISGGIALLLIIRSGYQVMMSQGDPEKLKEARERLTSVIVGLLFLIFSLVILELIGVDILGLPGLGDNSGSTSNTAVTDPSDCGEHGKAPCSQPTQQNQNGCKSPLYSVIDGQCLQQGEA